jgi:phospholipid transport system substrate-binding protein
MIFRTIALPVLVGVFVVFSSHGTFVQAQAEAEPADVESAKALIDRMHVQMDAFLSKANQANMPVVHSIVEKNLEKIFDLEAFASLALKRYYKKLKPKDQKDYIESFKGLVESTYLKRLKPGVSHWLKHRGEKIVDNRSKVSVTVGSDENEFDIDYLLMRDVNLGWRIYDIWIDDVSMARNYRSQFYKIYKSNGLRGSKGLIEHMNRRRKEQREESLK